VSKLNITDVREWISSGTNTLWSINMITAPHTALDCELFDNIDCENMQFCGFASLFVDINLQKFMFDDLKYMLTYFEI